MPIPVRRWKEEITPVLPHAHFLVDGVADADILHAVACTDELCDLADSARRRAVREARLQGATWEEVGEALGVSRQAAWERFKTPTDEDAQCSLP